MDQGDLHALESLQRLIEQSGTVGSEHDLDAFLTATAEAISARLGFSVVIINLYRPAWDDFVASTVVSDDPGAEGLTGSTNRLQDFAPLLDERFNHSGAYLARMDVEEAGLGAVWVPDLPAVDDPDVWGPKDWLLVPMRRSSGEIVGILSVDKPTSGRRPSENELKMLVAFTSSATAAVENAQQAASQIQHRRALERLLRVSTQLGRSYDLDDLLQAICDGISIALGFEKVAVELVDKNTGVLRTKAATGWRVDGHAFSATYSMADVASLFDPSFDVAGCFLVPGDVAAARVPARIVPYRSTRNGTGPLAWHGHWLTIPLHDQWGKVIGLIRADDPTDYLVPTEPKLQALRLFANQAATAIESRERTTELHHAHATRRNLLRKIVEVGEEERTRIAADLHDGPIQRLTALMIRLEMAKLATDRDDVNAAKEAISKVESQVGDEIRRLRQLMSELRPPVLDQRGLLEAIRDYADETAERTGLHVSVEGTDPGIEDLSGDVQTVLYRIVQEAVTNVVKHARASNVRIRILDAGGTIDLEVRDDGVGFDLRGLADAPGHFGLAGMRERAEMAGGSLVIDPRPGVGTTIRAWVPRAPEPTDASGGSATPLPALGAHASATLTD